jgi:hypothetical protein
LKKIGTAYSYIAMVKRRKIRREEERKGVCQNIICISIQDGQSAVFYGAEEGSPFNEP